MTTTNGATEPHSGLLLRSLLASITLVASAAMAGATEPAPQAYLQLPAPQLLALPAQAWEGDQQPHTMSVLEMNRDGYRYWAWYGLNNGRGIGLMRSNDLLHWTKFERNPFTMQ